VSQLYDAVAYCAGKAVIAYNRCRRLSPEMCAKRRSKYGVRRWKLTSDCLQGAPGCDRVIACNDYASVAYRINPQRDRDGGILPSDFAWEKIEDGLYGGTLKLSPERAAELDRAAKGQADTDAQLSAEHRNTLAHRHDVELDRWREALAGVVRRYYMAVADLAGVRNPDQLPPERLQTLAAIADAPVKVSLEDFVADQVGPAPRPPEEQPFQVGSPEDDVDAYFDHVLGK
jgi:hypothetical protein